MHCLRLAGAVSVAALPALLAPVRAVRVDLHLRCDLPDNGSCRGARAALLQHRSSGAALGVDFGRVPPGKHRALLVDQAGWHSPQLSDRLCCNLSDSAGAQLILNGIRKRWPWLKHLFADGAYDRTRLMDKAALLNFVIEIVRRSDKQVGFVVIPRRWVVERTFGWMIRWRRLVRDYEKRLDVSKAMIHVAMGSLLLRRIAHR